MKTIYADTGTGGTNWSCVARTDAGGIAEKGGVVLQDVLHDGHHFAKDIRLLVIWLFIDILDPAGNVISKEASRVFLRGSGAMTASPIEELKTLSISNPMFKGWGSLDGARESLDFAKFFTAKTNHAGYGLRVKYAGKTGQFAYLKNFEFDHIDVTQLFLLSHYGLSPPHEPGGVLTAARFHPMINYAFAPNPTFNPMLERRVLTSVRFDYRMQLYLDALYDKKDAIATNGQNAGVFRDDDTLDLLVGGASLVGITSVEDVIFTAAEKPLLYELTAPGLAKGASSYPAGPIAPVNQIEISAPARIMCWDNVHWWGGGVGKNIISTPGAFHAAHLHWRWGGIGGAAPHGSDSQFGPGGVPAGIRGNFLNSYGVLVDPRIWIQSVRFAVTLNDPKLDPDQVAKLDDLTNTDWKQTFQGLRASPSDIANPSDLVLWYSVEVHRSVTVPSLEQTSYAAGAGPVTRSFPGGTFTCGTEGTIFIHGIFFAHEPEQTSSKIGARSPFYMPRRASLIPRNWERTA